MFLSLFFKKSVLYNKVHYLQLKDVRDKGALGIKHCWKTGFEKTFSAWASTLNMGLINKR